MINEIESAHILLKNTKPLVLCLTNYVTMDFIANSLLALGAAPIMSCCDDELEELIKLSHAISINIGTLDEKFIERCYKATSLAKKYNKPITLDPVGSGASIIRTNTANTLMHNVDIIRGNASEIMSLLDNNAHTLGVESLNTTNQAMGAASKVANISGCIVAVSGEEDFITDGKRQSSLGFGSPLMPLVTGMGCALSAVIAAFSAVINDKFKAAELGVAYFGLCGSLSQLEADMPASFRTIVIDTLYAADFAKMRNLYDK